MAYDTPANVRNLVIYEIYVRNHGPNGTFADVEADLERIRDMGVDVVWFMPIHPIGKLNKKGSLGCPYSIADYRDVNPEYGTMTDFVRLLEKAHHLGLLVMIDVVYNHTAHDSVLIDEHPQWFRRNDEGVPVASVSDWSDIVDLLHPNPALAEYLITTLKMWAGMGVDGFRCDVASLLPLSFWQQARQAVAEINPDVLWLAESVHAEFVVHHRAEGLAVLSDGELYHAFDLTYPYDIFPLWQAVVRGRVPVSRYVEMLRFQDSIYPQNAVKLRCVENHDQQRVMGFVGDRHKALAWTAFEAFNKGAFLIYAGQESEARHTPSLFDIDKIAWGDYSLQPYLKQLALLKKDPIVLRGQFVIAQAEPAVLAAWQHPELGSLLGIFNVNGNTGLLGLPLPDGVYQELLEGGEVRVNNGQAALPGSAAVVCCEQLTPLLPMPTDLLNY